MDKGFQRGGGGGGGLLRIWELKGNFSPFGENSGNLSDFPIFSGIINRSAPQAPKKLGKLWELKRFSNIFWDHKWKFGEWKRAAAGAEKIRFETGNTGNLWDFRQFSALAT